MLTVHDLPIDIIRRIFFFATLSITRNLVEWKRALPLLKVCQSWRDVGTHILYNVVYIQGSFSYMPGKQSCYSKDYDWASFHGKLHSNISIIRQNNFLLNARKLNFLFEEVSMSLFYIQNRSSLGNSMKVFPPAMELIGELDILISGDKYSSKSANNWRINIESATVHNMASLFPNIKAVVIDIMRTASPLICVFVALLFGEYNRQLTSIEYSGLLFFKGCRIFTNLTDLDITTDIYNEQQVLPVCSETLRRVKITVRVNPFRWDMLYTDNGSNTVSFDKLESLIIKYEDIGSPLGNVQFLGVANLPPKKLRFPSLKYLRLYRTHLEPEEMKSLLQAPLKTLSYGDQVSKVLDVCSENLGSLDSISLEFVGDPINGLSRVLIPVLKEIFAKLRGIDMVRATILMSSSVYNISRVFWPNLTHLNLFIDDEFCNIIAAIPRMPDLKILKITIGDIDGTYIDRQMEFLYNFKQYYLEPSSSMLQMLVIDICFQYPDPDIVLALQVLKWYFPDLKTIKVLRFPIEGDN